MLNNSVLFNNLNNSKNTTPYSIEYTRILHISSITSNIRIIYFIIFLLFYLLSISFNYYIYLNWLVRYLLHVNDYINFYINYIKNKAHKILKYKNLNNKNQTKSTKCQYKIMHVKNITFVWDVW